MTKQLQEAYRKMNAADDRFQRALEKEYGKRAGDARYGSGLSPKLKKLKKAMQLRRDKYQDLLARERQGNPSKRKTRDYWAVGANFGQGWEEVTAEEKYKDARQRLKEYRENDPQHRYTIKLKREKIQDQNPGAAAMPRNKWINGQVRVTKSGKVEFKRT